MPAISFTRKLRHALAMGFVGLLLTISAAGAHAATTTVAIGFDTDNNAATGCTLTSGSSSMPGVETVLYTVVTTAVNTGTVSTITRSICIAGVFGAPINVSAGGWPVGMSAGLNGSDLIETFIPLADLGGTSSVKMGAITPSSDSLIAAGVFAVSPLAPTAPEPIPSLSPTGMLILLSLIGSTGWLMRRHAREGGKLLLLSCLVAGTLSTVSALAIVLDGNGVDWTGIAPLATDSAVDAPAGQDLVALYAIQDGANLALRVDMVLAREAGNQQPEVNAGGNQTIALAAVATLSGSATDDGLPNPPATLTYAWSKVSGPGTVTFGNAASAATSASFSLAGAYVLRLSASDSVQTGVGEVAITVTPGVSLNQAPSITQAAVTVVLPQSLDLDPAVTDDGLPNPPGGLTYRWTQVSGPAVLPPAPSTAFAPVGFNSTTTARTTVSFDPVGPGAYVLRLVASDGELETSHDIAVTVLAQPLAAPAFSPLPTQTVRLGDTLSVALPGNDINPRDTLTYSLLVAPTGAALVPTGSSRFTFTPSAGQVGTHLVTVQVRDAVGSTAQASFSVIVQNANRTPLFTAASKANAAASVGTTYARTLVAIDPDIGDSLTYALISGPAGLTISASGELAWSPSPSQRGDHIIKAKVSDVAGAVDVAMFTLTTGNNVAPLARDDVYEVRLGETLTIPAAGVLGNDLSLSGNPLTAAKLSDPDKGTINAFNADGGFNYTAPATLPAVPGLNPVVSWRAVGDGNDHFVLAADVDHDDVVEYVLSALGDFRAKRGSNGSQLWQWDRSITTHANVSACGTATDEFALGNVSDVVGGDIYLFSSINCDQGGYAGYPDRLFAVNASQILTGGKVATQWKSERLSRPHPGAYATASSLAPADPPITPFFGASADGSVPTLAKLTAGGSTKLLTRFLATDVYGPYYDTPNSNHFGRAACRTVTGLPADEGRACKATFVIDAATGAIDQVLTAPNAANQVNTYVPQGTPTKQNVPIVADLDGDGQVEIISGGDVWKLAGGVWTLAWQAEFASVTSGVKLGFEPTSVAVADLDGDGKAEVIIHIIGYDNGPQKNAGGIHIFNHDGTLRRTIPIPFTWINGLLSVADVDGDGAPEVLLAGDSFVYAYRQDGSLLWAKLPPDVISDVVPAIAPIAMPRTTDSPLYVYDLNLDGVPEVILQSTRRLFILNGRTGAELWSIDTESERYYLHGNPLLVDADNDGHVDILVHVANRWNCDYWGSGPGGCKGNAMRISGGDNNWAPGPKVQNQLNFRPTAINDTAQILYDASVRRDFRQQIQQGTVIDPRIAQSTAFTYKANDGAADSAPAIVAIDIKPPNRPPVITSIPPSALLRASPDGVKTIYTITAVDPDVGDTVHFELVTSSFDATSYPGPTVDAVTGNLNLYSCRACGTQRIVITVAAVDTQGARTEQSFLIDLSPTAVAVPNVIGQLLPDASTAIEAASLKPLVVTELFGPQAAGTVFGQDPLAGAANVGRGATVKLTVSKGPQPVLVPNVVGAVETAAATALANAGFSVIVARQFSTVIAAGLVISQSPTPGTMLPPGTAQIIVSSGTGLGLKLDRGLMSANGAIVVTPVAIDVDGNTVATPVLTYAITPRQLPFAGTLPTMAGLTITAGLTTMGSFVVTATDAANSRTAAAEFAVALPADADGGGSSASFARLLSVLQGIDDFGPALRAARAANDVPQMKVLLGQMVTLWRTVDLDDLKDSMVLVFAQGFAPSRRDLDALGLSPTDDDLLVKQVMRDAVADLDAWTQGLRGTTASLSDLNALADQFISRSARINALTVSEYGVVLSQPEYQMLVAQRIPAFYEAVMEEAAELAGIPRRNSPFPYQKRMTVAGAASQVTMPQIKSTLVELAVTQAVGYITDKIIEKGVETFANGKKFAVDVMGQASWGAGAMVIASHLRDLTYGSEIIATVAGASMSFHLFEAPYSFIEVISNDEPSLNDVMIIGKDITDEAVAAVTGLLDAMKEGFSFGKDAATNPKRYRNQDEAQKTKKELKKRVKALQDGAQSLFDITASMYQSPVEVEHGCIFDANPDCVQLHYGDGFRSVYKYSPPPGFQCLTGLPLPIPIIVQDQVSGLMFFGTPAFLPTLKIPEPPEPPLIPCVP